MTKHIICYSGGHSSALVALEVARRHGTSDMILLNHDMHASVEHADIKRFKEDVARHLGLPITYANHKDVTLDQFDVCVASRAFKVNNGQELCTSRLKTEPFMAWLKDNANPETDVIYYGFDAGEQHRIQRRSGIMGGLGWKTDYPLIWTTRKYKSTEDVGISRPTTYRVFKHGNCVGCLKAGWQHWYIVYCTRPDIWSKAKWAEDEIGHAIHHDGDQAVYLEEMEPRFRAMKAAGIPATEHIPQQRFWAQANRHIKINEIQQSLPCECTD